MNGERIEALLLDTDLHAQSVEQLVTKYQQMEQELEQGSHTQVISCVSYKSHPHNLSPSQFEHPLTTCK